MKTKFTLLAVMIMAFFFTNAQQVPNNSFETWTAPGYAPDGWVTLEQLFNGFISGFAFKDTVNFIDGNASIKLVSDSTSLDPTQGVIAGIVSLGSAHTVANVPVYTGIPFPYRPDTIIFDYQYRTPVYDTARMVIEFTTNHVPGLGFSLLLDTTDADPLSWGEVTYPLGADYLNASIPDTLFLQFYSSITPNHGLKKGSTLHVDNVRFGYAATGVNDVKALNEIKVYPNPASDVLNVVSAKDISGSNMQIFDVTGNLVSMRELKGFFNNVNIINLANGNYVYKITNTQNEILGQNKFTVVK